jgi:hypothetical protein
MRLSFQRRRAKGLDATFHMHFAGDRAVAGTVSVRRRAVEVDFGLKGEPDVVVQVTGPVWVELLTRKLSVEDAIAQDLLRVDGDPERVVQLLDCYPRYGRVNHQESIGEPA